MRGWLVATLIGCTALNATASDREQHMVRVLTPAFLGRGGLGTSVRTVLNLQLLQTLYVPENNPTSEGAVIWSDPLETPSHDEAVRAARSAGAQLALWGEAIEYANGVVVQAALTVDDRAEHTPTRALRWDTTVRYAGRDFVFGASVPSVSYEFEPFVLPRAVVVQFAEPSDLVMYSTRQGGVVRGTVGNEFDVIENHGDRIFVESAGVRGWVRLPQLSEVRPEIVDFVGGIMRIMRRDWRRADRSLTAVINNPVTPSRVLQDAHLYRAFARAGLKKSCRDDIAAARGINPYTRSVGMFGIMCAATELKTATEAQNEAAMRAAVVALEKILLTPQLSLDRTDSSVASAQRLVDAYRRR
ncbi:MAG: hypothetical protein QOJ98_1378 [Acidobacteriota bacterium]|jgi:hypothetical protein|nr:hypothetical protein [Acidobacteriota bacterium]